MELSGQPVDSLTTVRATDLRLRCSSLRCVAPVTPRASQPRTSTGPVPRILGSLASALLAAAMIASVVGCLHLPADARVAIHFTAGRPDRYAGRTFAVLAMPVTLLAFLAIGAGCVWSAARSRVVGREGE